MHIQPRGNLVAFQQFGDGRNALEQLLLWFQCHRLVFGRGGCRARQSGRRELSPLPIIRSWLRREPPNERGACFICAPGEFDGREVGRGAVGGVNDRDDLGGAPVQFITRTGENLERRRHRGSANQFAAAHVLDDDSIGGELSLADHPKIHGRGRNEDNRAGEECGGAIREYPGMSQAGPAYRE